MYPSLVKQRIEQGWDKTEATTRPPMKKGEWTTRKKLREYAVYRGDELICVGTAKECAEELGVKVNTIYWMSNPAYHKRAKENWTIVTRLEDDDDDI